VISKKLFIVTSVVLLQILVPIQPAVATESDHTIGTPVEGDHTLDEDVNGDLVVDTQVCGDVVVKGDIEGDLDIKGDVGGDIIIYGDIEGDITSTNVDSTNIEGRVEGDIIVGESQTGIPTCEGVEGNDPEISGIYIDNFSGWHSVGGEAWLSFGSSSQLIFSVCSVDNDRDFLVAQNAPGNDFNPGLFSRFEWLEENNQIFYCQQVFDASSAAEAVDFSRYPAADSSNANDEGCGADGQFPWSQLSLIS